MELHGIDEWGREIHISKIKIDLKIDNVLDWIEILIPSFEFYMNSDKCAALETFEGYFSHQICPKASKIVRVTNGIHSYNVEITPTGKLLIQEGKYLSRGFHQLPETLIHYSVNSNSHS